MTLSRCSLETVVGATLYTLIIHWPIDRWADHHGELSWDRWCGESFIESYWRLYM